MTAEVDLPIPEKLIPVFEPPRGEVRCRGAYGGRGSAKTRTFALMTAVRAYELDMEGESGVILCAREYQNSLDESSMEEVKQAIRSVDWLDAHFEMGEKFIRTKSGRIKYVFAGLRRNLDSIKSKARILLAWIDEADPVSAEAWRKLLPTVREEGSEYWVTWNPERDGSATDTRFRKQPPDSSVIVECQWWDNPFFPATLEVERRNDLDRLDPSVYAHVWEGAYLEISDAQVLKDKYRVATFDDPQHEGVEGPYYGADWGFSSDPTALVRFFVSDDYIWISHEAVATGVEVVDTPDLFDRVPEARRFMIRADNARPEMISHMSNAGFRIQAAKKWPGSVEDGVSWIRGHKEVIIHERCRHVITEARMWSYKTDKNTGDPLPDLVDAYNHTWDAIRYGAEPMIRKRGATPSIRPL